MEEEPADAKEKLKFMARSQEAYALISLSICSSHRDCLRRMGDNYDPADAWNAVLQHFGPTSAISQTLLLFQLLSLSQGSNDLETYFGLFNIICGKLSMVPDLKIPVKLFIAILLKGLSPRYKHLVSTLLHQEKDQTIEGIMQSLLLEEENLKVTSESPKNEEAEVNQCSVCNRHNHTEENCWDKYPDKRPKCSKCGRPNHFARDCKSVESNQVCFGIDDEESESFYQYRF